MNPRASTTVTGVAYHHHGQRIKRRGWQQTWPRIGEASNPGPQQHATPAAPLRRVPNSAAPAVIYPAPDRDGFRDFTAPGYSRDPRAARADEQFQMEIETVNSTGWTALMRRLLTTRAHAVLAQGTWVLQSFIPEASAWARRNGWKSIWAAATTGPGGGASAGVAIFVRECFGLRYPPVGPHVWHDARVVAGVVEAPSFRPFILASMYLRSGEGASPGNLGILADTGARLREQGEGWMAVMGGDQNMDPCDLLSTGYYRQTKVTLLYPPTERGTYRTSTTASTLEYFYVSDPMAAAVEAISTVECTDIKGHVPVTLRFKPRVTALRALHLRMPPAIEKERVYGPLPPTPDASAAMRAAERALAAARAGDEDAQACLDWAYAEWANLAEQELVQYAGAPIKKMGERAKLPHLAWRAVVPEKAPALAYPRTAALAWIRSILGELTRIGAAAARDRQPALEDTTTGGGGSISGSSNGSSNRNDGVMHASTGQSAGTAATAAAADEPPTPTDRHADAAMQLAHDDDDDDRARSNVTIDLATPLYPTTPPMGLTTDDGTDGRPPTLHDATAPSATSWPPSPPICLVARRSMT